MSKRKKTKKNKCVNKTKTKNIDVGEQFENLMVKYFNDKISLDGDTGLAYVYPVSPRIGQKIDILVDGYRHSIFIGIECKSIFEDGHPDISSRNKYLISNDIRDIKLYFSKMFNVNDKGQSQIERHHQFLIDTDRFGILAIECRCMNEVFLLPYQYVYDLWKKSKYITLSQITTNSYQIGSKGDLFKFIVNKCRMCDT